MLEDFLSKPLQRRSFLGAIGATTLLNLLNCVPTGSTTYNPPIYRSSTPTPRPTQRPTPRPNSTPVPNGYGWGSPQKIVSNARWPTLSDGSSFIAYIKTGDSGKDVLYIAPFTRNAEDYEAPVYQDNNLHAAYPFFEYDGRGILFVASQQSGGVGEIFRNDIITGRNESILEPFNGGGWFPSRFGNFGNIMVYSDRNNDVYSFQSGAAGLVSQYGTSDSLGAFPKASPADSLIVSASHDIIIKKIGAGPFGETTRWTIPGDFDYPCWSPDGERIAAGGISGSGLWVMNRDGSDQQKITSGHDFAPSWNGDTIAFMRNESGTRNIYAIQER